MRRGTRTSTPAYMSFMDPVDIHYGQVLWTAVLVLMRASTIAIVHSRNKLQSG
jgi:hypothetical protein